MNIYQFELLLVSQSKFFCLFSVGVNFFVNLSSNFNFMTLRSPEDFGPAEGGNLSIFHPESPYAHLFEVGAGLNTNYSPQGVSVSAAAVGEFHRRFGADERVVSIDRGRGAGVEVAAGATNRRVAAASRTE